MDAGVDSEDVDCAQARTDEAAVIDADTIAELRQSCEIARQFATVLADNVPDITDDQRSCLNHHLIALPPETITGFYTHALLPQTERTTEPNELNRIMEDCDISTPTG